MIVFKILYFASFLLPMLAWLLYKSRRPAVRYFLRSMELRYSFRKIYTLMVLLFLIGFHFYHLSVFHHSLCLLPSSILVFMMYSHRRCERLFHYLQEPRTMLAVCVTGVLCMMSASFLPMGFTLIVAAEASAFYPDRAACRDSS
jgi:ABC-type enterobactin transport system permease subunit